MVIPIVACVLLAGLIGLLVAIYRKQVALDGPKHGVLVVDKRPGERPEVYFVPNSDPGTYTDGMVVRVDVVVTDSSRSQGKQGS